MEELEKLTPHQCTNGSKALGTAARQIGIVHRTINLAAGVRVVQGLSLQNVNAYDSRLKQWMRRFHGIATRYLANYLGWRRMIDQARNSLSPRAIVLAALGMHHDQQLRVA